jgi:hypothetical protein
MLNHGASPETGGDGCGPPNLMLSNDHSSDEKLARRRHPLDQNL